MTISKEYDPNDFDNFASDYREIHTQNVQKLSGKDSDYFSEYKIKELTSFIDVEKNIMLLDLGCGDGNSARYIKQYYPKCNYYGIDISKESINIAKQKYGSCKNVSFSTYNGRKIPYEDGCFDIVFIACVMHHINYRNHKKIIKECMRVLKSGGKLVIFEHNPYNPLTVKTVKDCPFDEDAVLMSSKYLKRLVKYIGFRKVNTRYTIFVPRIGMLERLAVFEKYLYKLPIGGQYYIIAEK